MNLLILSFVFGTFLVGVSCETSSCNDYVDGILRDLKNEKEFFQDPYAIPEKSAVIHKKFIFVNYTGEAKIYDGFIFGLSSLHRDGDVIVDRKNRAHLKIYLGAGELKLQCKGKLKLMGLGPELAVHAVIGYVYMKLDIVPTSNGTNPKISQFKVEDVKGSKIKVTGFGPSNIFLKYYVNAIGKVFKNLVRSKIESRLKTFMDKKLKKYVIPQECLNDSYSFY